MFREYEAKDMLVIKDKDIFNSLMSGLVPIGAIFGALMIGSILQYGRKASLMLISVTFIVATGITLIFNFYALVGGRFLQGI